MSNLIQWPRAKYWDKAWNPVIGCKPCSPACENCYAAAWAKRFGQSFEPHLSKGPRRPPRKGIVFCGNMTDIFIQHEALVLLYCGFGLGKGSVYGFVTGIRHGSHAQEPSSSCCEHPAQSSPFREIRSGFRARGVNLGCFDVRLRRTARRSSRPRCKSERKQLRPICASLPSFPCLRLLSLSGAASAESESTARILPNPPRRPSNAAFTTIVPHKNKQNMKG